MLPSWPGKYHKLSLYFPHISSSPSRLCHEDCQDSGKVIEALAGWAGAYRWQRSRGVNLLGNKDSVSIETVRQNWAGVLDMEDGDFPENHQLATMDVMMKLNQE